MTDQTQGPVVAKPNGAGSGLPLAASTTALPEKQQRFAVIVQEAVALGEEQKTRTVQFYYDLGQLSVSIDDNEGEILNYQDQPATLSDLMMATGYKYNMLSKCARFVRRFNKPALETVLQQWTDAAQRQRSFSWSHIDALLSLGEGSATKRDVLVKATMANNWTALKLMEEVRKVSGVSTKKPGGGRPVAPKQHFMRMRSTLGRIAEAVTKAGKCVQTHYAAEERDDTVIDALCEDLQKITESISALLAAVAAAQAQVKQK